MAVVRNLLVEALGLLTAEMQEEHKYGKDILCPVTLMQGMLTKRERHIKKLNPNFVLVLHILSFLTLLSKQTYILIPCSYFWQDFSEVLGRTVD